jgi:hypothetical protein
VLGGVEDREAHTLVFEQDPVRLPPERVRVVVAARQSFLFDREDVVITDHRSHGHLQRAEDVFGQLPFGAVAMIGDVAELDHELGPRGIDVFDRGARHGLAEPGAEVKVGQDRETEPNLPGRLGGKGRNRLESGSPGEIGRELELGALLVAQRLQLVGPLGQEPGDVGVDPVADPGHEEEPEWHLVRSGSHEALEPPGVCLQQLLIGLLALLGQRRGKDLAAPHGPLCAEDIALLRGGPSLVEDRPCGLHQPRGPEQVEEDLFGELVGGHGGQG